MAEQAEKQSEATEGDKSATQSSGASKKKKILFLVIGLVSLVLLAGVPAAYFLLSKPAAKLDELTPDAAEEEEDEGGKQGKLAGSNDALEFEEGEEALGAIVPFDTFLVNLTGGKYVRVQVQVEFDGMDVPSRFYTRLVPIRDGIISLLTQQTAEVLEDSKGKDKLKIAMRNLMNEVLRAEHVRKVYFTQFVIQ
jgi:flagellar basal body-associated protein FliL